MHKQNVLWPSPPDLCNQAGRLCSCLPQCSWTCGIRCTLSYCKYTNTHLDLAVAGRGRMEAEIACHIIQMMNLFLQQTKMFWALYRNKKSGDNFHQRLSVSTLSAVVRNTFRSQITCPYNFSIKLDTFEIITQGFCSKDLDLLQHTEREDWIRSNG